MHNYQNINIYKINSSIIKAKSIISTSKMIESMEYLSQDLDKSKIGKEDIINFNNKWNKLELFNNKKKVLKIKLEVKLDKSNNSNILSVNFKTMSTVPVKQKDN